MSRAPRRSGVKAPRLHLASSAARVRHGAGLRLAGSRERVLACAALTMLPARAITPTPSSDHLALGVSVRERAPAVSTVHHMDADGTVWANHGRVVLRRARGVGAFEPFCRFPAAMPRDAVAFQRLLVRAARADKCNVYRTSRGVVIGVRAGTIYRLEEGAIRRRWARSMATASCTAGSRRTLSAPRTSASTRGTRAVARCAFTGSPRTATASM
ncbi:hypothetical protein WMF45_40070 [Sorangium sp. So ce448]|uniref:hypothetical protein n=1 Tax=Sorangium sp. So ce448 TaxID=3133314 RepID=UPI003F5EC9E7